MVQIGAFALIFDEQDRILLCHRRDMDLWNLPGGGVEPGQTPWTGAVREVREEVGLEVEVVRLAGVYSKPEVDEIVFSFVCRVIRGMPGTSDEADEARYFALDDIPQNASPKQVERIHDALQSPLETVLRAQHGPSSRQLFGSGTWPPA
jgi:8-oxo-dGTP diphosphatase